MVKHYFKMKRTYLLFLLLVTLVGCKTSQRVVEQRSYENPLLVEKMWVVTQINGKELQYPNQADAAYLQFENNLSIHGFGGCNNFSGQYNVSADTIAFDKVGATLRLCPQQEIEDALFKSMSEIVTFKASKTNLKLYDKKKRVVLNCIYLKE